MTKKVTMANKVREYTKANPEMSAKDVAKELGTTMQYVHTVWYLDRKGKKDTVKRKVGRPRKFVTPVVEMKPIQRKAVTLDMLHKATIGLQQERSETLEKEVENLRAVIRYLEGKVYGASVRG